MMCIQSPGSFVFAFTLAIRQGTEWYTWMTYVCSGIFQAILLCMCIIWRRRENRQDRNAMGLALPLDVEETVNLLENEED